MTDIGQVGDALTETGTALAGAAQDCASHGGSPKKCNEEIGQLISSLKSASVNITKAATDCSNANPTCKADVDDITAVLK